MKVTVILKNLSDTFYNGGFGIIGLHNLAPLEQFLYLKQKAAQRELSITLKVGNGSFRDAVDLNQAVRNGLQVSGARFEHRRGYKLATFEVMT